MVQLQAENGLEINLQAQQPKDAGSVLQQQEACFEHA